MAIDDLQQSVRQMLFAKEAAPVEGLSARGQRVYRRQVRRSLVNGVTLGVPIARALLGEEAVEGLIEQWLDASVPTTRLYWQLPLEFAGWVAEMPSPVHPALPELVHWETAEVDILNAPDASSEALSAAPTDGARAELHPSARLCIYRHPVHRMTVESTDWPEALETPAFIIAYRRGERVFWNLLEPQVAQLLAKLAEGATVGEGLAFLESLYGAVDRGVLVERLGALVERGALVGFRGAE